MFVRVLFFILAVVIAWALTPLVKKLAWRFKVLDYPNTNRKIHTNPTPLLGGWTIFLVFTSLSALAFIVSPELINKDISLAQLVGLWLGGLVLMLGGWLDDRYMLAPKQQIYFPIIAAMIVIISGSNINTITNPWGGSINIYNWLGVIITFVWLMGIMYTTKLLDGLDGLVTGLGAIGSLIIFALTQFTRFYQPSVGLLALILAGASLGFLVWNWHPAKIFLGEGGSLYIGFALGVLAIISGAKIATTLLVVGLPALDVGWVIWKRWQKDKSQIIIGDREHTHYRLLQAGFSHQQAVLIIWVVAAVFGLTSLLLQSSGKLVALVLLLFLAMTLMVYLFKISKIKINP